MSHHKINKKKREKMIYKSGCCVCGKELVYGNKSENLHCFYCNEIFQSNVKCADNHYVCDRCHSLSANELIQNYCIASKLTNPLDLAINLMKHKAIKMHGPEHHFLIPAVLLAAYYNQMGRDKDKKEKILQARSRAEKILGGFCGTHGTCGAAIGLGIFVSLIRDATPLSENEWKESNLLTSKGLAIIANYGGPRCCKRNTFLAINTAIEHYNFDHIDHKNIECEFNTLNNECKKDACPFFSEKN